VLQEVEELAKLSGKIDYSPINTSFSYLAPVRCGMWTHVQVFSCGLDQAKLLVSVPGKGETIPVIHDITDITMEVISGLLAKIVFDCFSENNISIRLDNTRP
jgi:hypothetical protein